MLHARSPRRLLAAGMLLAPALALPLAVGSTNTASAHAGRSTNVNGAMTYLGRSRIGPVLTPARHIHVHRGFSRTWT